MKTFCFGALVCEIDPQNGPWLMHAYFADVDVIKTLPDNVIRKIECLFLSSRY